jgi:Heterokaryon incompatibility protein (HET)
MSAVQLRQDEDGDGDGDELNRMAKVMAKTWRAQPYEYERLLMASNRPMIRLIKILAAAQGMTCLELTMSDVSLTDCPKYDALSYCWGGQKPTVEILCNGARLLITENAYSALCFLRHPNESRMLWIDAICINQSDAEEKSYQVSLMQDIYRGAQNVHVWLGVASNKSDSAMALVPEIQNTDMLNILMPKMALMDDLSIDMQEIFLAFFRLINRP